MLRQLAVYFHVVIHVFEIMFAEARANGAIYSLIKSEVKSVRFMELFNVQSHKVCAISCLSTHSCEGYSFDGASQQCKLHLMSVQLKSSPSQPNVISYLLETIIESTPYSDLAVGKTATSSSVYSAGWTGTLSPDRVVNGITDYVGDMNLHRACTNPPRDGDNDQWMMVDLGESHLIWGVNIVHQYEVTGVTVLDQPTLATGDFEILVTVNDDPALLSDEDSSKCAASSGIIKENWSYIQCVNLASGRYVRAAPNFTPRDDKAFCMVEFEVVGFPIAP